MDDNNSTEITAIDNLVTGKFDEIPDVSEGIVGKIKAAAEALKREGTTSLRRLVNMSIDINESANSAAEMIRDIREVDTRSQSVAFAADELVASVSEIAQNSESAAQEAEQASGTAEKGIASADKAVSTMENIASSVENAS